MSIYNLSSPAFVYTNVTRAVRSWKLEGMLISTNQKGEEKMTNYNLVICDIQESTQTQNADNQNGILSIYVSMVTVPNQRLTFLNNLTCLIITS